MYVAKLSFVPNGRWQSTTITKDDDDEDGDGDGNVPKSQLVGSEE